MISIKTIGVVGAGAMGRGIVQLFAQSGYQVRCFDSQPDAAQRAKNFVEGLVNRSRDKGKITADDAVATLERIQVCSTISELADCELVVEAIIEDLSAKQGLFVQLESVVAADCILASNTSSLVVAEIASVCQNAGRVAGLHFFNPVPLMKVAEIIAAVRSEPQYISALKTLVESCGHRGVVTADQPGFLVNHAGRGLYTEGLRLLEEQCASPQDIDTLMRDALDFRMGPFELMDLTGLDVSGKVMESIYEQFQQEPRFRPSSLVAPRIAAGLYGRKSGQGWYHYQDNQRLDAPTVLVPPLVEHLTVWIDPACDDFDALKTLVVQSGAQLHIQPDQADLLMVQPWGSDASSYCIEHGLDAARCVAIDPLPGLDRHRTLMLTALTSNKCRDAAHAILAQSAPVTVINDSPGFVCQRIVATIVNIACNIVQRGIADVTDLEDAVRLGLGYPAGPLTLGDQVGGSRIVIILETMQRLTGDMRYRPSLWLRRRAGLGVSLLTLESARPVSGEVVA